MKIDKTLNKAVAVTKKEAPTNNKAFQSNHNFPLIADMHASALGGFGFFASAPPCLLIRSIK